MSRRRRLADAVRRAMFRRPRSSVVGCGSPRADRGMVILEAAIAIPALTAVAAALAWAISIGGAALTLGDAVRSAARELARGEAASAVLDHARERNATADFDIVVEGGRASVSARREVGLPVPLLGGLTITIVQRAEAPLEWT